MCTMKKILFAILCLAVIAIGQISCSSGKKAQVENASSKVEVDYTPQPVIPDTFVMVDLPEELTTNEERGSFIAKHYWDRFDFKSKSLISRPDVTEQAFVDYIALLMYVSQEEVEASLAQTLKQSEVNPEMHAYFASLYEKYFYDPNSPFRNELWYISSLKSLTQSPVLSESDKSRFQFQFDMIRKNMVGDVATDFSFVDDKGTTHTLHSLKSEYTLLLFITPGCHTCEATVKSVNESDLIRNALSMNSPTRTMLSIVTIYLDSDLDLWRSHLKELPASWINAYDDGMEITQKQLYDIQATPTIYLLDKTKKVILKDTSVGLVENFFSASY